MNIKQIPFKVYPSEALTISVEDDPIYRGAHKYIIRLSKGYNSEQKRTEYVEDTITLQFVAKEEDGNVIAGLQSEQLAGVLLDRAKKLNIRFPSQQNAKQIKGLELFLEACRERVEDREQRGVFGELKI